MRHHTTCFVLKNPMLYLYKNNFLLYLTWTCSKNINVIMNEEIVIDWKISSFFINIFFSSFSFVVTLSWCFIFFISLFFFCIYFFCIIMRVLLRLLYPYQCRPAAGAQWPLRLCFYGSWFKPSAQHTWKCVWKPQVDQSLVIEYGRWQDPYLPIQKMLNFQSQKWP